MNYYDIREIREESNINTVNKLLSDGWCILQILQRGRWWRITSLNFILANLRNN